MKPSTRMRLVLTAALVLSTAACSRDGGDAATAQTTPPPEVAVLEVRYGSAVLRRELPGRLEAYRTAQVRARVEGILEKRLFEEGSDVKEGQLLYRIDPRTYQRAYDAAKADVAATKLLVERYRPLVKINAISQQEFDSAEAAWKQAEARLAQAALDLGNTRGPAPPAVAAVLPIPAAERSRIFTSILPRRKSMPISITGCWAPASAGNRFSSRPTGTLTCSVS